MGFGWRLGSVFGIPIFADLSWLLILLLLTLHNGWVWQNKYPAWGVVTAWGTGLAASFLLLASVLLHELGHSLAARAQGVGKTSITLFLFGGLTEFEQEIHTPGQTFQVAFAGSGISLGLAALLEGLAQILPEGSAPLKVLVVNLATLNLVVALFNLIPGLPLDGGQILKAAIWKVTGSRLVGVRVAARVGIALGLTAIVLGAIDILNVPGLPFAQAVNGWWIALLGWFGLQAARGYDRTTELQEMLLKTPAAAAMTDEFRWVDAERSLWDFACDYLAQPSPAPAYFAIVNGEVLGALVPEKLSDIERSQWQTQTLLPILHPLAELVTVQTTTPLAEVIEEMEQFQLSRIPVFSPEGQLAGVLDRGDVVRTIAQKLDIRISEGMLRQIKLDGEYPKNLPLPAIAHSLVSSHSFKSPVTGNGV